MLSPKLRAMLGERYGKEILTSGDCTNLKLDIESKTGLRLSETQLKRMMGLTADSQLIKSHRGTTMDIIAQYLGYANYRELGHEIGDDSDISMFIDVEKIDFDSLQRGSVITLRYYPNRIVTMSYLGNCKFMVNETEGGKLQQGDILNIAQIAKGFELLATEVDREGMLLGPYHAAKNGGVTSIEVWTPQPSEESSNA